MNSGLLVPHHLQSLRHSRGKTLELPVMIAGSLVRCQERKLKRFSETLSMVPFLCVKATLARYVARPVVVF